MGMFALLSFGGTIFILGRTVLMTTIDVETAQRLFLGMITSVLMAPISFFDTTPSSQIMSRDKFVFSNGSLSHPHFLAVHVLDRERKETARQGSPGATTR
ncbi:hypothetical protein JHK87_010020 [Glycine soja]|nr:hypothetical protein JHK87_010020 [Glycine soja]